MSRAGRALLGAQALVVIACALIVAWPRAQRALAASMHLTSRDYGAWWVGQVVPRMYFGANETWTGRDLPDAARRAAGRPLPEGAEHLWHNHYPAREGVVHARVWYAEVGDGPYTFELRTRYRDTDARTRYVMRPALGGPDQRVLVLERARE